MSKSTKVELRIPTETMKRLAEVARLAGVSIETVVKVLLAMEAYESMKTGKKKP